MFVGLSVLFRVGLGRVRGETPPPQPAGMPALPVRGTRCGRVEGFRELDRESKSPLLPKAGRSGAPSGAVSVSVLVGRRILFAAAWLGRLVCRVERGRLRTFLSFGSAISEGRGLLVGRSTLLNLRLGTTGDLLFRLELACSRRFGSSSSRNELVPRELVSTRGRRGRRWVRWGSAIAAS
jgi:hypothetical protein